MDISDPGAAAEASECVRQTSAWQERKLVHWVNSLPLPKCLLVEALADLRFGDVLLDIVWWVQHEEEVHKSQHAKPLDGRSDYPLTSIERLRLVLQFVARESRSADQEAMFLVNEAQCAERVKRGDHDAICAVVSILKRIACERETMRERTDEKTMHQSMAYLAFERELQRREKSRDLCTASSHNNFAAAASASAVDVAKKKQSGRKLHILGLSSARLENEASGQTSHSNRLAPPRENYNADMKAKSRAIGLQKKRMPRLKTLTPQKSSEAPSFAPDTKPFPMFHDDKGVLHIYGMIDPSARKNKLSDKASHNATDTTANLSRQLKSQASVRVKKQQVSADATVMQSTKDARRSGTTNSKKEATLPVDPVDENSTFSVNISGDYQRLLPPHDHETRRIHITKEQMQSVNRWLDTIDDTLFQPDNVDDRGNCFSFYKEPKTLVEVRENLARVFGKVQTKCQIPTSYLRPSCWEAIMMGDRQVTYGLLWYLWQHAQEQAIRQSGVESKTDILVETADKCPESTPRSLTQPSVSPKQSKTRGPEPTPQQLVRVSPILFDIPASVLASSKQSGRQGLGSRSSDVVVCEYVEAWKDETLFQHDLFPQPSLLPSRGCDSDSSSFVLEEKSASEVLRTDKSNLAQVHAPDVESQKQGDKTEVPVDDDIALELATGTQEIRINVRSEEVNEQLYELDAPSDHNAPKRSANAVVDASVASKDERTATKIDESDSHAARSKEKQPSRDQLSGQVLSTQVVDDILRWLKQLNVRISDPAALQTPHTRLLEFQSGVLLCCIVEKVEYMRCIQGIDRKPNVTKATALHNISKALEILQQKKTMPLHLLRRKLEIYNGDRLIILELLQQIRKAYGHHYVRAHSNFVEKPQKANDTLPE